MQYQDLKVGELARRTGLTVRTLHHYDEIGLLKPSRRAKSEHRMYTANDVVRLQQVVSLRQLGFSLEEIRDCLNQPEFSPLNAIRLQVARLREQIELQSGLCERLESLAAHFLSAEKVSTDEFLRTIEVMNMIENYYTPDQLETLKQRRMEAKAAGRDVVQQGTNDWSELLEMYRVEMENGTDPADPRIKRLEQRRQALIEAFTGGDSGIEKSLTRLWSEQGSAHCSQYGMDPKVMSYLGKVNEATKVREAPKPINAQPRTSRKNEIGQSLDNPAGAQPRLM